MTPIEFRKQLDAVSVKRNNETIQSIMNQIKEEREEGELTHIYYCNSELTEHEIKDVVDFMGEAGFEVDICNFVEEKFIILRDKMFYDSIFDVSKFMTTLIKDSINTSVDMHEHGITDYVYKCKHCEQYSNQNEALINHDSECLFVQAKNYPYNA